MLKILFDHDSAATQDLSDYIIEISRISRRVESAKPGEAGLIVFDNLSMEIPLSAFANDEFSFANLDANGDYLFTIKYVLGGTEYNLFAGLCDKSTVEHTEAETVRFEVLDKLSSLILLERQNARRNVYPLWQRVTNTDVVKLVVHPTGYDSVNNRTHASVKGYDASDNEVSLDGYDTFYSGEIIGDTEGARFFVVGVQQPYDLYLHGDKTSFDDITVTSEGTTYENKFYDTFITYSDGGYVIYFNALQIIEAIVKLMWPDITVINHTGSNVVEMSLDFYEDTIFDEPLGQHPLDALKFLAQSIGIYLYIDSDGALVMQDNFFGDTAYDVDLSSLQFLKQSKKYQWDKRIDYVLIKKIDGYDPENSATFGERPQNPTKKPRNKLERDVFLLSDSDSYDQIAQDYYDFYSARRESMSVQLPLKADTITLDLTKKILLNNGEANHTYFIEGMNINLKTMTMDLQCVYLS